MFNHSNSNTTITVMDERIVHYNVSPKQDDVPQHLDAIKQGIVDLRTATPYELAMHILCSNKFDDYLGQCFKGEGSFTPHYTSLILLIDNIASQLNDHKGFSASCMGGCWVMSKV